MHHTAQPITKTKTRVTTHPLLLLASPGLPVAALRANKAGLGMSENSSKQSRIRTRAKCKQTRRKLMGTSDLVVIGSAAGEKHYIDTEANKNSRWSAKCMGTDSNMPNTRISKEKRQSRTSGGKTR